MSRSRNEADHAAARPRAAARGREVSTRSQRGELLIELLMTTSIVTICVIGLVGALGSNFRFSAVSREINNADQLLTRYAEALAALPYEPCTDFDVPYAKSGLDAIPNSDLPARVTTGSVGAVPTDADSFGFAIDSVQYWQGDTDPATFATTCPKTDPGIQRLVLAVSAGDDTVTRRVKIIKRAP